MAGAAHLIVVISLLVYVTRLLKPVLIAPAMREKLVEERTATLTHSSGSSPPGRRIHILIPLHAEQRIVTDLHARIVALTREVPKSLRFYLVTSERERGGPGQPTTRACLEELDWPAPVILLHLREPAYGKGAILNRALNRIEPEAADWIGVFDADSDPDARIFGFLDRIEEADIVQQPSLYLGNFSDLNASLRRMAMFQTVWCFGSEVPRYIKYGRLQKERSSGFGYPYLYPVSHGLFLRSEALEQLGGFPAIYEDLRLGVPLVGKELRLVVAPYFDTCGFAVSIADWIRQSGNWAHGSWFLVKDLGGLAKSASSRRAKLLVLLGTGKGILSTCLWNLEGFFYLLCLASAFTSGSLTARIGALLVLALVWCCYGPLLTRAIRPFLDGRRASWVTSSPFFPFLGPLLRSLGPVLATVRILVRLGVDAAPAHRVTPKGPPLPSPVLCVPEGDRARLTPSAGAPHRLPPDVRSESVRP